jgi:hypothetical protein
MLRVKAHGEKKGVIVFIRGCIWSDYLLYACIGLKFSMMNSGVESRGQLSVHQLGTHQNLLPSAAPINNCIHAYVGSLYQQARCLHSLHRF